MSFALVVYSEPLEALVVLTPDSLQTKITGTPYTDANGRQGHKCDVPAGTPTNQGAWLDVTAPGHLPINVRGFLMLEGTLARFQVDDFYLPVVETEPEQPPVQPIDPGQSPAEIVNHVYETTRPNLATVDGCGKFTEDCCTALHDHHSAAWGHIKKNPGQNKYNGHAVDAVMLLGTTPDCSPGGYDIIFSSASPEAKPAFNYAGPPDYELWYYPAATYRVGVTLAGRPVLRQV